jgi:hypothetical protein
MRPISTDAYVRIDQQRKWAKRRKRRDGPAPDNPAWNGQAAPIGIEDY